MSLAVKWNNEHKQRWANIDRLAEQNRWNREAKAEVLIAPKPEPIPEPEPEPIEDGWAEQQITKHKPVWFSVISATKLTPRGAPTIRTIQRATCDVYGVKLNDLLSARRTANVVIPRHVSMYLAKELTALSYPRIGRATGDRDHTVAIYAHNKIKMQIARDKKLAANVRCLISMFAGASR